MTSDEALAVLTGQLAALDQVRAGWQEQHATVGRRLEQAERDIRLMFSTLKATDMVAQITGRPFAPDTFPTVPAEWLAEGMRAAEEIHNRDPDDC